MNSTSATSADLGTLSALERACFDEPWTTSTLAAAFFFGARDLQSQQQPAGSSGGTL